MKAPNKFIEAALSKQFDTAKELLLTGIDINAGYGESQWTALHFAVEDMTAEAAKWLLDNGADPNRVDTAGWTPLHLAIDAEADWARQQHTERGTVTLQAGLTILLLKSGANPSLRTNDGETALSLARSVGNFLAVEVLEGLSSPE